MAPQQRSEPEISFRPMGTVCTRLFSIFLAGLACTACNGSDSTTDPKRDLKRVTLPTMRDVISSEGGDRSCECAITGICFPTTDAITGYFEGRNLRCGSFDPPKKTVECTFEERFVESDGLGPDTVGAWVKVQQTYYNYALSSWCLGPPSQASIEDRKSAPPFGPL